jgi:DnaJ-domain-containing protein 1
MMFRKRPDYLLCPKCGCAVELYSFITSSYLGAVLWSDGMITATMLPDPVEVTKCRRCRAYFWVSKAKRLTQEPQNWRFWERRKSICQADLTGAEYLEAIALGAATSRHEEIYLRVRAWWAENDIHRRSIESGQPLVDATRPTLEVGNLLRLSELQDEAKPGSVLTKAEIARELGRMEQAKRLLERTLPPEYEELAIQVRHWVQAGEFRLQRFTLAKGQGMFSFSMEHQPTVSGRSSKTEPSQFPANVLEALETLSLTTSATYEDVKKQYRTLMQQYHPDKVSHLGPEIIDVAKRKSLQINLAYDTVSGYFEKL